MDLVYMLATVLFFWISWRFAGFCDSMDTARTEPTREAK
jgi:hypothetical protein